MGFGEPGLDCWNCDAGEVARGQTNVEQHAIRHLAGKPVHLGRRRCRDRWVARLGTLARRAVVAYLEDGALVVEGAALEGERTADDFDVFLHSGDRPVEGDAPPVFVPVARAGADAEDEAAAGDAAELAGGLSGDDRRPVPDGNAGAEQDTFGIERVGGEQREDVAASIARPDAVEPGVLGGTRRSESIRRWAGGRSASGRCARVATVDIVLLLAGAPGRAILASLPKA
ncbi:MAG: hypothetical protein KatS3mg060_2644 [Dehalococcoidia bacterium]|nr:MAG: hypothetical protein KatS3mg060_2644 [Dehalococcoidia bacterium]